MCTDDDDKRPNPEYTALDDMLTEAEALESDVADALVEAHRLMDEEQVWTGPTTASTFLSDLEYRKDDLPTQAERLVEAIREARDNTPEEISASEIPGRWGDDVPV